jgi:hypothetical protein
MGRLYRCLGDVNKRPTLRLFLVSVFSLLGCGWDRSHFRDYLVTGCGTDRDHADVAKRPLHGVVDVAGQAFKVH